MSTRQDSEMSRDPLFEELDRQRRSQMIKGIVALIGVAIAIGILLYGFIQMAVIN